MDKEQCFSSVADILHNWNKKNIHTCTHITSYKPVKYTQIKLFIVKEEAHFKESLTICSVN